VIEMEQIIPQKPTIKQEKKPDKQPPKKPVLPPKLPNQTIIKESQDKPDKKRALDD